MPQPTRQPVPQPISQTVPQPVPQPGPPLILASASPRRRMLLERAGVPIEIAAADIVEVPRRGELPPAYAERLAGEKALAIAGRVGHEPRRWVLGADTIVVLGEEIFGKPDSPTHAIALLRRLAGRRHRVMTAIALADSASLEIRTELVVSVVEMREAADAELAEYVATGEPLDKAGAYAIQGEGRRFMTLVEGSETNVIGLPVEETLALLPPSLQPQSASAASGENG